MQSAFSVRAAAFAAGLVVALATCATSAQSDAAAARLLFEEGRSLVKNGQYAKACPKFEQSYLRDRGIGTLFNLADCWEHLGRTASAWAKFRDVADEAARTNQKDRKDVATQRAEALFSELSHVIVRIAEQHPGLLVLRDGVALLASDQGRPIPLDPGGHVFEASAPGKQSWKTQVTVPPEGQSVEVVVPPLLDVDQAPAPPAGTSEQERPMQPFGNMSPEPAKEARQEISLPPRYQIAGAYVAAAMGVAGIAAGTIFGLRVNSKNEAADSICPSGRGCSLQEISDFDSTIADAKRERTISFACFGVGGVALVTSAVLYLTAPKAISTAWHFVPAVQRGQAQAVVTGNW